MTTLQAKEILLAYRPWADDAADPEMAAALARCRDDSELAGWFAEHCARQTALRARFKSIAPPDGLAQQILSEYKSHVAMRWWRRPMLAGALAGLAILLALGSVWFSSSPAGKEDLTFSGYRSRMVRTALRAYGMDLETNDLAEVRGFLAARQAPADYVLPASLAQTPTVGCGVLRWQNKPVAMICFRTGKPLAPGAKSDLFLFVIEGRDLEDNRFGETPEFSTVSQLVTASWRTGEKIYLLAAFTEADLRQRL